MKVLSTMLLGAVVAALLSSCVHTKRASISSLASIAAIGRYSPGSQLLDATVIVAAVGSDYRREKGSWPSSMEVVIDRLTSANPPREVVAQIQAVTCSPLADDRFGIRTAEHRDLVAIVYPDATVELPDGSPLLISADATMSGGGESSTTAHAIGEFVQALLKGGK